MAILVSDIHFGRNKPGDVNRAVAACKANVDDGDRIVVVAGDFTQKAKKKEYEQSEEFLRELIDYGCVIVATPGNHDFGLYKFFGKGTDKVNLIPTKIDRARRRYRKHVLKPILEQDAEVIHGEKDGYDTITRVGDDVWVSLRSTHRPRLKSARWQISRIRKHQAKWAHKVLKEKAWGDRRLHFVTHRSLWQTISDTGDKHKPMKNRKVVEKRLLAEFDFATVIHGHNHALRFERVETPKLGIPVLRLGVPTLSERVGFEGMMGHAFIDWDPSDPERLTIDGAEGREPRELGVSPDPI